MRKGKGKITIQSQRRARGGRVQSEELESALQVVNGEIFQPERFKDARKFLRKILTGLVDYSDRMDDALAGVNYGKTRAECMEEAARIATGLLPLFDKFPSKFEVLAIPTRKHQPELDEPLPAQFTKRQIKEFTAVVARYRKDVLPHPDDFFRLRGPMIFCSGDVVEQLYWDFIHGIGELDDFRRIRRCSNEFNHTEPYYFVTIKVQRQPRYFCNEDCRRHYHNNKPIEEKQEEENGRIRPRETKE